MLSREEVVWLHRCFLGRDPSSEADIEATIRHHVSFEMARTGFIMSREFQSIWGSSPRYVPKLSTAGAFSKTDEFRLAFAAIVKNEEHQIEDMIASCAPIADHFVMVDTGSTDRTIPVMNSALERYGCSFTVSEVEFVDFAQARNAALEQIPAGIDWIFMIDADERLMPEDYADIRAMLGADVDGWRLPRYNFYDAEKREPTSPYPDYQARLFRANPQNPVRYTGAVHEQPQGVARWRAADLSSQQHGGGSGGAHIHHLGHVIATPEKIERKQALYNKLSMS